MQDIDSLGSKAFALRYRILVFYYGIGWRRLRQAVKGRWENI
jgi:hypothetical protein